MAKRISSRIALLATAAIAVVVASAAPARAQNATPAAAAADDGTIIVTARRREESLLNVPIAISAFSGAQLERQGAIDITDISNSTPNVTLETSRGTNSTLTAFIRGIGQQDPVAGFEQGVGIYLDDVYLNRPQAAVLDIYDVERIEVLRGPQGTLYGRNTIGGAIKYVTRRLPDEFELRLRGTYGSYNQADGVVTASAPVGNGTLRFGASLARLSRGGFGDNLTTGLENYNKDIWAGRVSAEVHGTGIFARLAADYTHDRSLPRGGHRFLPGFASGTPVLSNVYDSQGALASPRQDVKSRGVSLFVEAHPTEGVTLRSITAYRRDKSGTPIDFDALPAVDVDVPAFYANSQFSQELQALVDSGGFHGLVGAYFLDAKARDPFDVRLFTTLAGLTAFTNNKVLTNTSAVFGDFTYDFNKQLSLAVGGRYTWDNRRAMILRQNYLGGGSPLFGGAGVPFGAPSTNFDGKRSFHKFTPRASLSFKPDSDNMLYVSYSRGFKGGGFDPRGVGVNAPDTNGNGVKDPAEITAFLSFLPETVTSYEAGYKAALFDRRLNLALAIFRANYRNEQIPGSAACTVGGIPTFCGVTTNAARVRFQGIEAEANARLFGDAATGSLSFNGSLGYIDSKFQRYITNITGTGPTDVSQYRHVQNTPKFTGNAGLTYDMPIGPGRLDLTGNVSYRSKTYQFEIANPFLDQPGYALLDGSIVYRAPGDRWTIGVFGKNLTDKHYVVSGYTFLSANPLTGALLKNAAGNYISALGKEGTITGFYGNPRQVFVTGTVKF